MTADTPRARHLLSPQALYWAQRREESRRQKRHERLEERRQAIEAAGQLELDLAPSAPAPGSGTPEQARCFD